MPDITYAYVTDTRKELLQTWNAAHLQWRAWETLYHARHKIRYAALAEVRKLAWARAKINSMVDTLVTRVPVVTREPVGEGQKHESNADAAEHWATALLEKAALGGSAVPPFRTGATFIALLGYAVRAGRWDDKAWEKKVDVPRGPGYKQRLEAFKAKQKRAFPFVIEFPHPARVLLPHMEKRPSLAIETASMYGWQVEKMLEQEVAERLTDLHAQPFDVLEVINYWDEDKRGLFIAGQEVEVRVNGLGEVPYGHSFSGYGFEAIPASLEPGPVMSSNSSGGGFGPKPEDLAVGLLAGMESTLIGADEYVTALAYLAQRAANPQVYAVGDAEELAKMKAEAGTGGIVPVDSVENIKWEDIPTVAGWMSEPLRIFRENWDEGTFQGIVQGQTAPGNPTATGQAQMMGAAKMKFDFPMAQLNLLAGEAVGLAAKMTALRGERVTIGEVTCGNDEFEDNFEFTVDFMSKDEAQKLRATAAANEGYKLGTESFEGVQEAKGVADVTGKWKEILIGKARTSEQYQGFILQAAMGIVQQKMAEAQAKSALPTNGAGAPVGPEGPQSFVPQPGGPIEAQQVQAGMEEVPGQGMQQVIPGA